MRIGKWTLQYDEEQTVMLPATARILDIQIQHDKLQMWAMIDPALPEVARRFAVVVTGIDMEGMQGWEYLKTVQHHDGHQVLHVFEIPQIPS